MRIVTFNLFHLSSIQQGIQGGHAANAVRNKYPRRKDVKRWATKDLTIIHKNGGDCHGLADIVKLLGHKQNKFAWADFREPDMENTRTSVAVCIPDDFTSWTPANEFEEKFISLLKRTKLAI